MRVGLYDSGVRTAYTFDPAAHKWSTQAAGAAHLIGLDTGLPNDLAKLFVKRWNKTTAPAQGLLMRAITAPLPHTPRVVGHGIKDKDHYYFFSNLPKNYRLLDKLIRGAKAGQLKRIIVDQNIGLLVCKSASKFMEGVNSRGFVYPDFTHKNIMIGGSTACEFIDVDSCFPAAELQSNMGAGRFAIVYWGVWREIVGVHTPTKLSQTMVLSFAIAWARAAALQRAGADEDDVRNAILNPNFNSVQAPFWRALQGGTAAQFAAYFGLKATSELTTAFEDWKRLLTQLKLKQETGWAEIVAMSEGMLRLGREAPLAATAATTAAATTTATPVAKKTGQSTPSAGTRQPPQPQPQPRPQPAQTELGLLWLPWAMLWPLGRLTRLGYLTTLVLWFATGYACMALNAPDAVAYALMWSSCAFNTKRLHDWNRPSGWLLGVLAPATVAIPMGLISNFDQNVQAWLTLGVLLAWLALTLFNLFAKGDSGPNRFGPPKT